MGLRDEDFAWVTRSRLAALVAVAGAARQVLQQLHDEALDEEAIDLLSDVLFTLDRGGEGWAGA